MRRARICAGMGFFVMSLASSTWAGQAELSIENRFGFDTNVFRGVEGQVEDGTHEITPRVALRDEETSLGYAFEYQPTYRTFFKTSGIDGMDHSARGRTTWAITPADRIEASGSYVNTRQFVFGDRTIGNVNTFDVNDRERIRQSDAHLGYRHVFDPRWSTSVDAFLDDFDAAGTDEQSQNDSRAFTGRFSTQYALTERLQLGTSVSARRRDNRAVGLFRASSLTDVWDVMGSIAYDVSPTIAVSVQAGPSFIRQQQVARGAYFEIPGACDENTPPSDPFSTCVRFPKDESDDVTVFAALNASKKWKASVLNFSYVRSEARSGTATSSSSIADRIEVDLFHQWSDQWTARALFGWDQYDQLFRQQGDDEGKLLLQSYRAVGTVEYAFSKRILLIGQYSFVRQQTRFSDAPSPDDVDVHMGYVGLRFTFEPISY